MPQKSIKGAKIVGKGAYSRGGSTAANNDADMMDDKFQELFEEHFKIFCLYRFYNSHTKAMQMRQEELDLLKQNKNTRGDDEDLFVTPGLSTFKNKLELNSANPFARSSTAKHLQEQQQSLGQVNWIKRNNKYNEDELDIQNLPEENLIVASWINELGQQQKEFDVSTVFFHFILSIYLSHYLQFTRAVGREERSKLKYFLDQN